MSKRSQFRKDARLYMAAQSAEYPKDKLVDIPRESWPSEAENNPKRFKVMRSRHFLAQLFLENDGVVRISVTKAKLGMGRTFDDGISWDELQAIKKMCGYGQRQAVEIYPPEEDVVNDANMRHLWVLREELRTGWKSCRN